MRGLAAPQQVHVFVERSMSRWLEDAASGRQSGESAACLDIYRVEFVERLVCERGQRVICHFRAPDAESVRQAMRGAGIVADAVWVAHADNDSASGEKRATIVCFAADRGTGPGLADIRNNWRPSFRRSFTSKDRSRIIEVRDWK